jgi:hypothetical protein
VDEILQPSTALSTGPASSSGTGRSRWLACGRLAIGVLWLLLLILPGSLLVLPLLVWWKVRREATAVARRPAPVAAIPAPYCP